MQPVPNVISHDLLLKAVYARPVLVEPGESSIYLIQLRHNLLSLARKAHLEVMVQEATGLEAEQITNKSTIDLLVLLDRARGKIATERLERLRYWS